MTDLENSKLPGIALVLGLLIGLERGWREFGEGMRITGLCAYGLISLLGGLSALLARQAGPLPIGVVFIALTLILLATYSKNQNKFEDIRITSETASMLTFILGARACLAGGIIGGRGDAAARLQAAAARLGQ
ncbi:MgtC/SapB family protein [Methylomicrobium album]|uniref:MgtC/SapB family protein n=1 Tax=Methylomicrobium album TaxID=39775 RepID=UPI00020D8456|nr:MgtC/SapB family protein [Methylomicrobium album]